nr:MAG: hypothetical protein [Bacteriophage sp.]
MGEIATWSAVKTKVGLGKDSNECPTKAELLALSPTGTGENYVGLEISNASSYGNNETVQLSDIHKVTYRYAFTVVDTVLNFPALGGYPTPRWFGLGTTKQKQIDGVAIGDTISVGYTQSAYPDWIVYDEGYKASENTTLNQRSASLTFTQNESGKQITVQFTQDAGVETWEYTFTSKNNSLVFNAIGGKGTPTELTITSNKQKYINGKAVGSPVNVDYSRPSLPSWLSVESGYYEALENKSESSRSYTDILTQAESGKKLTPVLSQAAGVKTYGTPTVYLGSIADIPASGGTAATPTYTYSQLWGWNGKTNDGGTISSGASVVWSENISGSNLGTTAKARTKLGSRTLTVTLNGKSGSASIDVYQAENKITNVTQGAWVVSISANPSTFTEQGGTSQISASARASRTNHWSSGATNAASDATGTPTLSIPTAVTGFSLSGTTLTVAENKTANQRSVVVRATMDTVYKEITVTQSAYLVEWQYTFTASPTTLSFDALGTAKSITITSYREKYINGSLVEGSRENVSYIHATSTEHIGTVLGTSISMQENQTTSTRSGQVSYEQNGSNKVIRITCNQAAGTISTRDVLEVVDNFGDSPAVGGSIFGLVKSGYYDVINGKDSTWHNVTPTLKSKSSYITNVEITKASGDGYNIGITLSENTSESSRRASLTLTYGSKEVDMATTQAGASVSYNYYFGVTTDFPSVAAAGATPKAVIKSRRHKVVNGVEESSYNLVETSVISKPNWTGTLSAKVSSTSGSGADYDVTIPVYENTEASIRRGTVVLQQGGSGKQLTLNLNQLAASITTRDYINYVEPIPDGMFSALAQSITVTLQSYRETLINGKVTSKVAVQPDFDLDSTVTDWASVDLIGGNPTNYEYDFKVSVKENTTNQTRSGSVMFYNGTAEVENGWAFTQDAATISTRYEISWTANYSNGTVEENVTEVELEGTTGMENSVRMDLHILEYTSINGVEGTPTSWDSRAIAENNSAIASPSGQVSATLQSDSENAFIGITNSVQNLAEYPRTHTITLYNYKVVINGKEVGTVPTITLLVNPIPYTRIFEFSWKQEGSTITNITLEGDIYGSSAGSRDIISYVSLRRNNVEFTKKYVKPTFIPPSEDWLQVIDNGQNSDNSYNWAFRALTNNEGDSARNQQVRFEQPGNGNQALYAYVSQDPMDEGYLGGRVNNNGPRAIRLNTVKDEQFLRNIDVQAGNFYGLGTLAQDAITIEVNVSVAGTDSSTYTQQVELSNLRFSESGRPVTISNDPNQNTDYEYSWELYPNANVPASFTVNISMLSSDGDNDDGIRLDIIKKNTAVFPIGTLIGDLTLTPKDPTKLPILLCAVYHRYFT